MVDWDCNECEQTVTNSCEECGKNLKLKLSQKVYCVNNENGDHFCSRKCAEKYLKDCIIETDVS